MRLVSCAAENGRNSRSSAPEFDDALYQRRVLLPRRRDDHDEGIVAHLTLAHRLDDAAEFRIGALNLAQREIRRPPVDQFLESLRGGGRLDIAEPDRKKRRARRRAVRSDRVVQKDFGGVVRRVLSFAKAQHVPYGQNCHAVR